MSIARAARDQLCITAPTSAAAFVLSIPAFIFGLLLSDLGASFIAALSLVDPGRSESTSNRWNRHRSGEIGSEAANLDAGASLNRAVR
jgi:hypothetical protein